MKLTSLITLAGAALVAQPDMIAATRVTSPTTRAVAVTLRSRCAPTSSSR